MHMRKRLAALGLTAGLLGGGAAGFVLGAPNISGAQSTTDGTATTTAPGTAAAPAAPADWTAEALAPLVADGTITQAQADAVVAALAAARPDPGPRGGLHMLVELDTAASAIGIEPDALREALASGQTLAEVAEANGVEPQVVVDALVASARSHLADDVASGDKTQAEADQILADVESHITDVVNGTAPVGPPNGGPGRGGPHGGFGGDGPMPAVPGTAAPEGTTSTTTASTEGASLNT
jgi:hypothetical protein